MNQFQNKLSKNKLVKEEQQEQQSQSELNSIDDAQFEKEILDELNQQKLNQDQVQELVNEYLKHSVSFIDKGQNNQAMFLLKKSEQLLNIGANQGFDLDRNLIICVLYNQSCINQSSWNLEKCGDFLDAVLFNLEAQIKVSHDNYQSYMTSQNDETSQFRKMLLNNQMFYIHYSLQYCAILSQMNNHWKSLKYSLKVLSIFENVFDNLNSLVNELKKPSVNMSSSKRCHTDRKYNQTLKQNKVNEVNFQKILVDYAQPIIQQLVQKYQFGKFREKMINLSCEEIKKSIYYWRSNPENNEKHFRKELKVVGKNQVTRGVLGLRDIKSWIEDFNIGKIMHMNPILPQNLYNNYELINEISKKSIIKKVLFLSITLFTVATEMRFIESENKQADLNKLLKIDFQNKHQLSEIFHLKSIQLVCELINNESPYINHIINSYQKHYNQNLEEIKEESQICNSKSISKEKHSKKNRSKEKEKQKQNQKQKIQLSEQDEGNVILKQNYISKKNQPAKKQKKATNNSNDKINTKKNDLKYYQTNLQNKNIFIRYVKEATLKELKQDQNMINQMISRIQKKQQPANYISQKIYNISQYYDKSPSQTNHQSKKDLSKFHQQEKTQKCANDNEKQAKNNKYNKKQKQEKKKVPALKLNISPSEDVIFYTPRLDQNV